MSNINTIKAAAKYDYPANGEYAETVATLADGRRMSINTQYAAVLPQGDHAADCDQLTKMGGRCTCGLLDGIDIEALVADAIANGKFGERPTPASAKPEIKRYVSSGVCPYCHTYCDGDCQS